VTAETPDIPGGKIARDAKGAPTGYFADRASIFVDEKIPSPPLEEKAALTAAELKRMSAYGITSLMDAFVTPAEEAVWRKLYDTGRLPMRVRTAIYVADPSDDSDEAVARLVKVSKDSDVDPDFLHAGVVKVFADGVMEYPAQTAALLKPYLDANGKPTKHEGELYFDPERFARLVQKLDAAGLTVHVHAIGDRAVRASLDAFASARAANGDKDNRHQIAHLQLVDPADFPRFKELGVIADFQLEWAKREPATEGPLEPYLGPERYRYVYPAGSLHKAGATIIGGSDWDVSSYNPFRAFQTGVTRSGGNDFHGSAFYFFRDHYLSAYPALNRNPANPDPYFQRQQFGFASGGPIRLNRAFFFGSWERNEQRGESPTRPDHVRCEVSRFVRQVHRPQHASAKADRNVHDRADPKLGQQRVVAERAV
jgi:predicted amidohydrolase YtcJ